jgi:hypothetical protein
MFYVIEAEYTGPNNQQNLDSHTYHVQTCPGRINMSHQPAVDGWLGTTNDWAEYAHGEYATLEEAIDKIRSLTNGEFRERDIQDIDISEKYVGGFDNDGNSVGEVVYSVLAGALEPWDADNSQTWCYEGMRDCIDASSTDADIDEFVEDFARMLADRGGELDTDAVQRMVEHYRDDLRAKIEDIEDAE